MPEGVIRLYSLIDSFWLILESSQGFIPCHLRVDSPEAGRLAITTEAITLIHIDYFDTFLLIKTSFRR